MITNPIVFLTIVFILSIVVFALYGLDSHRQALGKAQLPSWVIILTSVIAPFGALMGLLLWRNRRKALYFVTAALLLVAWLVIAYLI